MSRNSKNGNFLDDFAPVGSSIVVAGPSSSLTLPGIIVSKLFPSLCENNSVVRIDVDPTDDFDAGLHRSQSLAAAHHSVLTNHIVNHRAPNNPRLRTQVLQRVDSARYPSGDCNGLARSRQHVDSSVPRHRQCGGCLVDGDERESAALGPSQNSWRWRIRCSRPMSCS